MEFIVQILAAVIPLAATAAFLAGARVRRTRWRALAEQLQLTDVREQRLLGGTRSIQGERAGFLIRVTESVDQSRATFTHIAVDTRGRIPRTIDLRSEGIATSVAKHLGRKEIEIGDDAFDSAVFVRGPELALQAALDLDTRLRVCELLQAKGRVADGIVYTQARAPIWNPMAAAAALERALDVAKRLTDPEDLLARLCERFRWEHSPGVRLRLLDLLADRFPAEPEARAVFREALLATDDRLRLHAARVLGEEGRAALLEIAAYTDGDNAQAVRAIELLGRRLPIERALDILNDALRIGHRNVARAAIQTLGLHGGPAAVDRLAVVLAVGDLELAAAAAHALAATEDPCVEALLLAALPTAQPDVAVAVCEGLACVGGIAAVPQLRETAIETATDRAVALAARHAIAGIQTRLTGASPGQVSLAEGESGDLSLAEDDASGRLSLPAKPSVS